MSVTLLKTVQAHQLIKMLAEHDLTTPYTGTRVELTPWGTCCHEAPRRPVRADTGDAVIRGLDRIMRDLRGWR